MGRLNRVDPEDIKRAIRRPVEKPFSPRFDKGVVSTGSTLLDLAISGKRVRGGGVPGGIIMEIFGPPGSGKSILMAEILASVQLRGGDIGVKDPEARLDQEYMQFCGIEFPREKYEKPNLVPEVFRPIRKWVPNPTREGAICAQGIDSLSALSTQMEMDDKDKMGMRRAKEFSEECRKTCRVIEANNWLIVATNHEKDSDSGPVTPGGKAIPFYASLRVRITKSYPSWKLKKKVKFHGEEIEQVKGVVSTCEVVKSSVDTPFRKAEVYIIFNYGLHDVMANLQFVKDYSGAGKYMAVDKGFQVLEDAVQYVENNVLELPLREITIDLWEEMQKQFEIDRKPKVRF